MNAGTNASAFLKAMGPPAIDLYRPEYWDEGDLAEKWGALALSEGHHCGFPKVNYEPIAEGGGRRASDASLANQARVLAFLRGQDDGVLGLHRLADETGLTYTATARAVRLLRHNGRITVERVTGMGSNVWRFTA